MVVTEIQPTKKNDEKIRLAAYCRVSSDSSDQMNSFAAQIKYYTDYSKVHTEYELVDIYADEGISGTFLKKRDEFKRLIRDCENRKIDCIITKSISRFARNTSDLLTVLRMLKTLGVRVYFEEQALDSDKMNAELLVTLPGLAAQQESINISDNMRWSYRKRMESGDFNTTYPAFGYRISNNELIVNEDEAKTVCTTQTLLESDIYSAYIAMMSKLKKHKSEILDNMINQLEYIEDKTNPNQASISAIDKQIADLSTQNLMIARLRTKSILNESEFSKQALEINSKISKLRSKRKLLLTDDSSEETISNLKHLSETIDNFDYRDGFNEEMFSDTVDQIRAGYDNRLVFTLSGGLELTEIIR